MKRTILFVLALCLCFAVFGTAFAETVAADAPKAETPATEMTAEELYQIGYAALQLQDYGKAMEYFEKAADLGSADALFDMGIIYYTGEGVEQDYGRAFECFQKAAELGDALALNNVGDQYEKGLGVEQDYAQALKYYQQTATWVKHMDMPASENCTAAEKGLSRIC